MLLEAGAEVNAVDSHGFSPLHRAVSSGISDSVQLLLDHGADVNSRTTRDAEIWPPPAERSRPTDPIHTVPSLAEYLRAVRAAWPCTIPSRSTPLELASRIPRRHMFPLLLRAGAEIPDELSHPYLDKVTAAGGVQAYEKQHRKALEKTFASKFEDVPEDVVAVVVAFWGHPGCY